VDILKDASATAIYGSRGANGVIIITTKKGKTGAGVVTYDGSYGVQNVTKTIDLLNAHEWATLKNDAVTNTNNYVRIPAGQAPKKLPFFLHNWIVFQIAATIGKKLPSEMHRFKIISWDLPEK